MRDGRVARCPRCGSLAHPLCASELGRCPTLGCGTSLRHAPVVAIGPTGRRGKRLLAAVHALVAGSLLTLLVLSVALVTGARVRLAVVVPCEEPRIAVTARVEPERPLPGLLEPWWYPKGLMVVKEPEPEFETDRASFELTIEMDEAGDVRAYARNRGQRPLLVVNGEAGWRAYSWSLRDRRGTIARRVRPGGRFYLCCGTTFFNVACSHFSRVPPGERRRVDEVDFGWFLRGEVDGEPEGPCTLVLTYQFTESDRASIGGVGTMGRGVRWCAEPGAAGLARGALGGRVSSNVIHLGRREPCGR